MSELVLLDADSLDYAAFVRLQKEAFNALLTKLKASDAYMTPEYFAWKLHPPLRTALITVIREGSEYIASNVMVPVVLTRSSETITGWQSGDSATAPAARGKGYFLKCQNRLREAMGDDELFYGFPNKTSAPGLAKLGWKERGVVTIWISPLPLVTRRRSTRVGEIDRFDERQDELARRLSARPHVMTERSAAYLDWRYRRHPLNRYTLLALREGDRHDGFAVLRTADVMGRRMALVMELWALDRRGERALLRHAAGWAVEQGVGFMVAFDTALPLASGLGGGLVPVPHRLLPKRQVLMVQPKPGEPPRRFMAAPWRVQMGDWDVF